MNNLDNAVPFRGVGHGVINNGHGVINIIYHMN
jgi:hypothetical protein